MNPPESAGTRGLLTVEEAAEWLSVTPNWVREKVATRAIPHTRVGRYVRFTREQLEQIAKDGAQRPVTRRSRSA